jgi:4-hydroxybenzoate polyprenyltransferase
MAISAYLEIIRPAQWYKNLVIFVALIFSMNLLNGVFWIMELLGFVALCLASSGSYVVNDILDSKRDMSHPRKASRPIPSGRISRNRAIAYAIVLLVASEVLAAYLETNFLIVNSLFIVLTFLYSSKIKNVFLVEAFVVALNYVIRGVSGAFIIDVRVSPWLIIGIFFLALLLVLGKRKCEILSLSVDKAVEHRPVLKNYTSEMLNYAIATTSAAIIVAYAIYSVTGPPGINDWRLVLTIPVAFFVLTRYVYRTFTGGYRGGEFTDILTSDRQLIGAFLLYVILVIFLLYFAPHSYFR